jgi:hypothetical protein
MQEIPASFGRLSQGDSWLIMINSGDGAHKETLAHNATFADWHIDYVSTVS